VSPVTRFKVLTYDMAMAIGADAANQRMREAGRTRWNRGDYARACQVFNRAYGSNKEKIEEHVRQTFRERALHAD
jgi:hypothetical protein